MRVAFCFSRVDVLYLLHVGCCGAANTLIIHLIDTKVSNKLYVVILGTKKLLPPIINLSHFEISC